MRLLSVWRNAGVAAIMWGHNMKHYLITLLIILSGCASDLRGVNEKVNSYQYTPDTVNYMKTPAEFYTDGGGDCEDFANAKYWELKKAGYENLQFVLIPGKPDHVVLQVGNYILDNQTNEIELAMFVKGYRLNYEQALIAFNNRRLQ